MKIFASAQIKEWDKFTIAHEPVSSIDLMERAASECVQWLMQCNYPSYKIFCSNGNNGGDGLAIARLLFQNNCAVTVYLFSTGKEGSPDFTTNFERLKKLTNNYHTLTASAFPPISKNDVVIDALFGTGLNKLPEGTIAELIDHINQSTTTVVSIDMPSGLYADKSSTNSAHATSIIKANYTLTFQQYKLALLMAENHEYFGRVILLDIGLHHDYYKQQASIFELTDAKVIKKIYSPRDQYSHKGNFGYACLLAGSYGMMGAAVLAARSCLKSGVGKLMCSVCEEGYTIVQTSVPEAMASVNGKKYIKKLVATEKFDAIGIGPGTGIHVSHARLLQSLFKQYKKPIVIDADALNVLAENKKLLTMIPAGSILTPHPTEFDRLFGNVKNKSSQKTSGDFDRMERARKKSIAHKVFIVLKGHHTLITTPDDRVYINSTGNAGMATGGSGDVLTGILTGLLAQGYSSLNTCLLAVYLHGLAGDIAAKKFSQEAMIAGDITKCLGDAFKEVAAY